jgi:adenylate kinase family enzyme
MKKIAIIGATASGKTTLANKISKILDIPVYHLDKIAWKDNRVFAAQALIIEKVDEIIKKHLT